MNQRTKMLQALFMSMQIRPENNPMDAAIILQSLCDAMEADTPMEAVASILSLSKEGERLGEALKVISNEIFAIHYSLSKMENL